MKHDTLREGSGWSLIAGDFNKSRPSGAKPVWTWEGSSSALSLVSGNGVTQWIREGAEKEEAPPGTQDDSAKTSYKNILRKPGS